MTELFSIDPHIFWLSLGGVLLAVEMLGGNGYLLWSGIASIITGLICWVYPFSWEWQGTFFAILTLLATWFWWRWQHRAARRQPAGEAFLNQRGKQLIGRKFILENTLVNGHGNVRVGDSSWPVVADQDLPAGATVEVLAVDGITLRIRIAPPR